MNDQAPSSGAVQVAPYGSWSSPITTALIVSAAVGLGEVWVDGPNTWWSELRPTESGRVELVRDGVDVLGSRWSARTRVHEYGGGAWWVHDGVVFFANWADQRLYRLDPGAAEPAPLSNPKQLTATKSAKRMRGTFVKTTDDRWCVTAVLS